VATVVVDSVPLHPTKKKKITIFGKILEINFIKCFTYSENMRTLTSQHIAGTSLSI
jgi:hypothetical protein